MVMSSRVGDAREAGSSHWRATRILIGFSLLALSLTACSISTSRRSGATPTPETTATPTLCSTWRVIPSPDQHAGSALAAVTALSATNAWAVGSAWDQGSVMPAGHTLIEQWDGSSWRVMPSPGNGRLAGVAAIAQNDAWAVGSQPTTSSGGTSVDQTLIEHWNGSRWNIVPGPTIGGVGGWLRSVIALAPNDVWAVGAQSSSSGDRPLIEHWDGKAWQVVASPSAPGAQSSSLYSITRVPQTNEMWAVGYTSDGGHTASGMNSAALIEHWDGRVWSLVAPAVVPADATGVALNGVVALSVTDAWAVGRSSGARGLIEHWNGATWQLAADPGEAENGGGYDLVSVAAASARDVRVVGNYPAGDPDLQKAVIAQWDGAAWSHVPGAPAGLSGSVLSAISTDPAGAYWAVGGRSNQSLTGQALILHCP